MTNNFFKNNYTAVLGSESRPRLDLRSGSRVHKKWPDWTWTGPWTVYRLSLMQRDMQNVRIVELEYIVAQLGLQILKSDTYQLPTAVSS